MKVQMGQVANYWTYGVSALLIAAAGIAFQVGAQAPSTGTGQIAGMPTNKPVAPVGKPRPGETKERPFNRERGGDNESVSSFIDSLQGTDSAFQLIVGQSRMFTTREPIAKDGRTASLAVSDPSVIEFEVLPNPRMIRLIGLRAGVTDLTFTTSDDKTYSFEVHVTYDLDLIRAQLRQVFPDAFVKLGQLREHLVVEGQARSTDQLARITQFLDDYLLSIQRRGSMGMQGGNGNAGFGGQLANGGAGGAGAGGMGLGSFGSGAPTDPNAAPGSGSPGVAAGVPGADPTGMASQLFQMPQMGTAMQGQGGSGGSMSGGAMPRVINLMTVPGIQQVLLQVQIAELNRTALREIGVDWLLNTPSATIGTQISNATISPAGGGGGGASTIAGGSLLPTTGTTAFGIFPSGELTLMVRALRRNQVLNVLAEPNLVALNGQDASFLAGGEFAVPIPQPGGSSGGTSVTVQYKTFGVMLNFVPTILDDETIRLKVAPEASTLDYAIGTTVLGTQVPGLNTRRVNTTVELKQGQTLALAGILTVEMDGSTARIPLLGDLPYIGTMFSNTSHKRQEKELVVLVTPHLITPMEPGQVPCLPGDDIQAPNDLELYLLGRIEGRTGRDHRSTTSWDNPLGMVQLMKLERSHVYGPVGFSDAGE